MRPEICNISERLYVLEQMFIKMGGDRDFLNDVVLLGTKFQFYDVLTSRAVEFIISEFNRGVGANSNVAGMEFNDGDCIIDIGGNIGTVSMYLAKKHPNIKIYAYEPTKRNYENFLKNIKLNNIPDGIITLFNKAVTKDSRDVHISTMLQNSGGSNIFTPKSTSDTSGGDVPSTTLDKIFEENNINKCALLKIDCEGAEYEILYNTKEQHLRKCACILGELHGQHGDVEALEKYVSQYISKSYWDKHP
ncbi:hypothetical protein RsTz2092_03670 [Deferribacterales bacterium RsTz2092]|nr:hypothetical protein AGMMS49941_02530 [Deferribacterales bacterium]